MEWRKIPDFDNYEISNTGVVRSNIGNTKILKQQIRFGYNRVNLQRNKQTVTCMVHRLVASAFIPNPENKPCIDHINRNKGDNTVENLRWATYAENSANNGASNISFSRKYYKVQIMRNGVVIVNKRFKTLVEAQQFRQTLLI